MCNKSESIVNIAKALVAFSGEIKSISHDAQNPHFKSQYTSLDHMIDETKPILTKHGLTVMQFPGGDGEKITVRTMILHTSGEWMETEALTLRAVKTDPQGAGSAITYARRYSYAAALSLSLGDDDDGNAASHAPQNARTTSQPPKPPYTPSQPQSSPQGTTGGDAMASEAQRNYIFRLKNEKKISDEDLKRMIAEMADGKTSTKDLTKKEAGEIITFLNNYQVPVAAGAKDDDLPF